VGELSVQTAELSAGVTFDPIPLTSVNTPCGYSSLRREDECYNSSLSPSPAGGQTTACSSSKTTQPLSLHVQDSASVSIGGER